MLWARCARGVHQAGDEGCHHGAQDEKQHKGNRPGPEIGVKPAFPEMLRKALVNERDDAGHEASHDA